MSPNRDSSNPEGIEPDFTSPHQPSVPSRVGGDVTDEALARRSQGGDSGAFGELVERYQKVVYTLALRMTGSPEDAADLTQGVFLKAWRGLAGFDPGRRFFSWMYRISIHECLNHRRGRSRFEELDPDIVSPGRGPEARAEESETEVRVQRALEQLSDGDRQIVILRHFLDRSYEEIAEAIGVPAKTVKSRLFSARQRLRVELEKQGVRDA